MARHDRRSDGNDDCCHQRAFGSEERILDKLLMVLRGDPFSVGILVLLVTITVAAALVALVFGVYAVRERLARGSNRATRHYHVRL